MGKSINSTDIPPHSTYINPTLCLAFLFLLSKAGLNCFYVLILNKREGGFVIVAEHCKITVMLIFENLMRFGGSS